MVTLSSLSIRLSRGLILIFSLTSIPDKITLAQLPLDGLVAYFPFNGNASDESGKGHDGTASGAVLIPDRKGKPMSAYSFDGLDDFIEVPHSSELNLTGDLTLSAWFSPNSPLPLNNNAYTLIAKRVASVECCHVPYNLSLNYSNPSIGHYKTIIFATADNGWTYSQSQDTIQTDTWAHVALTVRSDTIRAYLNGVKVLQTLNGTTGRSGNTTSLLIGSVGRPTGNEYMRGYIDDVAIYNRALDPSEIQILLKADQEITFDPLPNLIYGDIWLKLQAGSTSGLPIIFSSDNPDLAHIAGDSLHVLGAGTVTVSASQPGNDEYHPASSVSRKLIISKAPQALILLPPETKSFRSPPFEIIAVASSGLPVLLNIADTSVAQLQLNTVVIKKAGSTLISAHQPGNANYMPAVSLTDTLVIEKEAQSIHLTRHFGKHSLSPPFNLLATATSGLTVSFAVSDTSVINLNGAAVTIKKAGYTLIIASQSGNDNYLAAPDVVDTLVIDRAVQSITFNALPDKSVTDPAFTLSATSSSGLPVIFTSPSSSIRIAGNTVSVLQSGRAKINTDQSGNENYHAANTVERTFCILPLKPVLSIFNNNTEAPVLASDSPSEHLWYLNGALIAGATGPTLAVVGEGVYTACAIVDDCAGPLSEPFPLVVTAEEDRSPSTWSLYPQPVREYFSLQGPSLNGVISVGVFTVAGQSVLDAFSYSGEPVDVQFLSEGIYLVKLMTGNGSVTLRMVKH
jgi:hypothetical protein